MKVYINGLVKEVPFDEISKKQVIYTTEGIFCNYKKKLTRIETIERSETIIKDNYTFLIDYSEELYGDTILHIPYDHLYCEETYSKTHIGFNIYYIKYTYFDQISYYFEVDRIDDDVLYEIITFLST